VLPTLTQPTVESGSLEAQVPFLAPEIAHFPVLLRTENPNIILASGKRLRGSIKILRGVKTTSCEEMEVPEVKATN
jgi:hypothetical protein